MTSLLREALSTTGASALIPKVIQPDILEYVRRYSPFLAVCPTDSWDTNTYYYNERTALGAGGAVSDGGARAQTNSSYVQQSFQIRLFQTVGGVTGFAQAVTRSQVGDLLQKEVEGNTRGLTWDVEASLIWGNSGATALASSAVPAGTAAPSGPMPDGLDTLISQFSASGGVPQNTQDGAHAGMTLAALDELCDMVETNFAGSVFANDWMFVMSPRMDSKIAQLLTNQQRYTEVQISPGLLVASYRNIPIVKSSFLAGRSFSMGTPTTATATAGGTLAAATYFYQVSAVIARFGEIAASAEVSQVTTGATSTVTLTVAAPTGPDSAGPILYKVYRATATGAEVLVGIVDAFDTTGVAVTSIIDTGSNLLTNSSANTGPTAYQGGFAQGGNNALGNQKPRAITSGNADEDVYLLPLNKDLMVRPYVRDFQFINLAATTAAPDTLPFATVTDTALAVRGPKYLGRLTRYTASI